jgi:hypothetical protein
MTTAIYMVVVVTNPGSERQPYAWVATQQAQKVLNEHAPDKEARLSLTPGCLFRDCLHGEHHPGCHQLDVCFDAQQ